MPIYHFNMSRRQTWSESVRADSFDEAERSVLSQYTGNVEVSDWTLDGHPADFIHQVYHCMELCVEGAETRELSDECEATCAEQFGIREADAADIWIYNS